MLRCRCIGQLNTITLLLSDILYVVQKGLLLRYSLEAILDTFFKQVSNYTRFRQVKGVKKIRSVKNSKCSFGSELLIFLIFTANQFKN